MSIQQKGPYTKSRASHTVEVTPSSSPYNLRRSRCDHCGPLDKQGIGMNRYLDRMYSYLHGTMDLELWILSCVLLRRGYYAEAIHAARSTALLLEPPECSPKPHRVRAEAHSRQPPAHVAHTRRVPCHSARSRRTIAPCLQSSLPPDQWRLPTRNKCCSRNRCSFHSVGWRWFPARKWPVGMSNRARWEPTMTAATDQETRRAWNLLRTRRRE